MKRNRGLKVACFALALAALTGCDKILSRSSLADDREDSAYRAALADYRAGRLDAAAGGFAKAIRRSPGNAEARFQYACLMQDTKKDYLEAFCAYREFLMQHPESDKARIAQDRLAICERELAKELAAKHGLAGGESFAKEIAALREDLKAAEARATTAEKAADEERARYQALESEHRRLVSVLKNAGDDPGETPVAKAVELKDVLEEEDEETAAPASSLAEVKALKDEESAETAGGGSSLLPEQYAADRERRDAAKAQKTEQDRLAAERAKKAEAESAKRPKTYVVQEGDTLYKIALRFYGRVSAWRRIREANKAIISTDGKVRAGQAIALP